MNPRRLSLIVFFLLSVSLVSVAYGASTYSILYSKFNSDTATNYQLDSQYTSMTINLKCYLTFNETTESPTAKVAITNDTGDTPEGIHFLFKEAGDGDIYKIEGVSEVKIGDFSWLEGNKTTAILSSGYLTVYEYYGTENQTVVLDDFAFGNYIEYVRVKGADAYVATDGYVQVEVNTGVGGINSSIDAILPTIVALACLGMAIGMVKKMGS